MHMLSHRGTVSFTIFYPVEILFCFTQWMNEKEKVVIAQEGGHLQQRTSCQGWHLIKGEGVCSALTPDINQRVTIHKGYIHIWVRRHWSKPLWRSGHLLGVNAADQLALSNAPLHHGALQHIDFICSNGIRAGMSQKGPDWIYITWLMLYLSISAYNVQPDVAVMIQIGRCASLLFHRLFFFTNTLKKKTTSCTHSRVLRRRLWSVCCLFYSHIYTSAKPNQYIRHGC